MAQCVVALRPSSNPAAANGKAPVQTDPYRRTRRDVRRRKAFRRSSLLASRWPNPPETRSVSTGNSSLSIPQVGVTVKPTEVGIGLGLTAIGMRTMPKKPIDPYAPTKKIGPVFYGRNKRKDDDDDDD